MKKKLPLLVLSAIMLFGIASCGNKEPIAVTITNETSETNVLGGSTVKLKGTITGDTEITDIAWSSSDKDVATVTNGIVKFANVTENRKVTITATSVADGSKSDSVEFSVEHSPFDLKTSHANELDYSTYLKDGVITHGAGGDPALMFNGVYGTQWYVEATIRIDSMADGEDYAKYGIMTGNSNVGTYISAQDEVNNAFYYIALDRNKATSGWTECSMVGMLDDYTNWNWSGTHAGTFYVSNDDKVVMDDEDNEFTMGLLRDGGKFYMFAKYGDGKKCYASGSLDNIKADEPTYAWIGGFNIGATIKNIRTLTGEAIKDMYEAPSEIILKSYETGLYLGETYQIRPSGDKINFDYSKIEYSSSDESLATVSADGIVTASSEKAGNVEITAKYGSLSKTVKIQISDNPKDNVNIDGKKDDAIYEGVAKYEFALKGAGEHIDFYATRNIRGVYIFADIYVKNLKGEEKNSDWWENDNFEVRFLTENNIGADYQLWASAGSSKGNFTKANSTHTTEADKNGLYNVKIETFALYEDLGVGSVDKDTILGIRIGSNPATGWNSISWDWSAPWGSYLKLTEAGLVRYNDDIVAKYCSDGEHDFTEWYTAVSATCIELGTDERYCTKCGFYETKDVQGKEHTWATKYDRDIITVTKESTCSTHGEYTTECIHCHVKNETVFKDLPLLHCSNLKDHSEGHEGEWIEDSESVYGGYWSCCGSKQTEIKNESKKSSGGWEDRAYWTEIFTGLTGDFEFNAKWTFDSSFNDDSGNRIADENLDGNQWRHPLLIVSDGDTSNWAKGAAYGDGATFRMDWCGWMNDRNGDSKQIADNQNSGTWFLKEGGDFWTGLKNVFLGGYVELNAKRVGNDLTLTYVFHGVDGYVYDGTDPLTSYVQTLTGLHTNVLDFSLSAEFASFTLNSARLVTATAE